MAKIGKGIQIPLSWIPVKDGHIPSNAISIDEGISVVRCKHDNNHWEPGKVVHRYKTCYYPYGGEEKSSSEYEVLCDTSVSGQRGYEWEHASCGNVPKNAIVAGLVDNEPLYIAKGSINGEPCVGKVHHGHQCAYLPWGGKEHSVQDYQVLVWKKK
ncbi:unnamed protein product [Schistosoma turkestanicum]|nr:unnamed protein product [Schistosoma turkestanicum]